MEQMGNRGVTRPMMHEPDKQQDHDNGHDMMMSPQQRTDMLNSHQMQTLWIYWLVIMLGVWVLVSPFTFDYAKNPVMPSGGRPVWLSLPDRIEALRWSDIISGVLLIVFGYRSLRPNRPVSVWICCFVGIWLSMAPLVLWSPSAAAYLNDTLVGVLVIGLTILIPGMPNMIMYMEMGPDTPPGWSYNPSSWPQRWIMIVLGFLGWLVSRYLAAFQLGYLSHPYDPFFGDSTIHVLNSAMSHALPVSDGGLGSFAYTFEFLMGWMGSSARWRTMPWMVTFFGILVIPLGLVHIFLVISQPLVVGYWCTFCILAAVIMMPMIPLEVDEVIAMVQYMKQRISKGENFWKVFWRGGGVDGGSTDERSPTIMSFPQQQNTVFQASIWGMSFPWTLALSVALGIWLVFSPAVFGVAIQTPTASLNHLCGALIVVVAVISMGEVLRMGRYLNVLLGLTVAGGIWFIDGVPSILATNCLVVGLLIAALAIPRGQIKEHYGDWDQYVK
ncbi:vitamin K epoxide reductase family protein [Spirosoma sp. KUDC1026]|uniref:vitamin K epoxide reductase family protein n=1 Tax=Spirosoma sp. KUDC1026 TaxID=2745947 RepID=UPI00159BCBC3|nr:vitamin K epoxide reductase family protein [Spirosoma sp. KUDC1026]QKZ11315.1 vitamin K epoxide reductase family protein [Spirosoma sp. KUDC1026]